MTSKKEIDRITELVAGHFRSFGRGSRQSAFNNPIAIALADRSPTFAAGVDIRQVVKFVLFVKAAKEAKK